MPQITKVPRFRVLLTPLTLLLAISLSGVAQAATSPPTITRVKPLKVEIGKKLTITGKNFRRGKKKNTLVFKRDGKRAVFVKVTSTATSKKIVVTVPSKLMTYLTGSDGRLAPRRFRLRVLSSRFGRRYTSLKLSPSVAPSLTATGETPVAGNPGSAAAPAAPVTIPDCDSDTIPDSTDLDDDNDGLSDALEAAIKTDPCNADSDGDGVSDAFEYESSLDLNSRALPFPGKRPYPNALDGSDAATDYDGDGLAMVEEYILWMATNKGALPLNYSDGDQDTNASGASTPALGSPLDMNGDGVLTDDEKDADGDGLGNWDEAKGRLTAGWWTKAYETEKPFAGYPGNQVMAPLNFIDPDVDGDGLIDGDDDQDHDGWTNIQERSRSGWPATSFAPVSGDPNAVGRNVAVNPYNPCLPDTNSRTCSLHPPFQDGWAPFDGSLEIVNGYALD